MDKEKVCSYKSESCEGEVNKWRLCEGHQKDYTVEPHHCHFCGENVIKGYTYKGERHYLSDCRSDLVKHEPGEDCTWSYEKDNPQNCYAYQNRDTRKWENEHIHFDSDGPM